MFADVVRSEWTKLRTVRSTYFTLAAAVVASIVVGALASIGFAHQFNNSPPLAQALFRARSDFDPTAQSLVGNAVGQLAIGVLGVLALSAEYRTGMIRTSLAAVPNRPLFLAAKALVFGTVALVAGQVLAFASFLVGQAALSSTRLQVGLGSPHVLPAVVAVGVYLTLIGLLGLGLGALIRHTAGAVAALAGITLVLPQLVGALPSPYNADISPYLPLSIGQQAATVHRLADTLPRWVGIAVLAGYAALALVVGGFLLVRRDA